MSTAMQRKRAPKLKLGQFPSPLKRWPTEDREEFLRNARALFHGKLPTVKEFLRQKKAEVAKEG